MTETMKVPKFIGNGSIEWGEKPVPVPGSGQLLIEVKANALCGSERGQFYGGTETTPGHEASGIVAQAGPDTRTAVGTPGVVFLMGFCGKCANCLADFTNQCLDKQADYGFNQDGGYGPYMVVNENVFFAIDPQIPLAEATMLLDVMGTGGHAINRGRLVHKDIQSVVVTGSGPIGLGVLAMAKLLLGRSVPVFITDYVAYRLELAEQLGGIPVNLSQTTLSAVMGESAFSRADLAVDTTGKEAARRTALDSLNQRGVLVCVGHGQGLSLDISVDLISTERAVLGSEYFAYHELADNMELLKTNFDYIKQIITHRFAVADILEANQLFFGSGETGKVLIVQ